MTAVMEEEDTEALLGATVVMAAMIEVMVEVMEVMVDTVDMTEVMKEDLTEDTTEAMTEVTTPMPDPLRLLLVQAVAVASMTFILAMAIHHSRLLLANLNDF